MPPRLLSADTSDTETGKLARSYGYAPLPYSNFKNVLIAFCRFVDTVHGPHGEGSIWTDNRFTNKFAAMPSLHFGYSLLIGLTIMTIPSHPSLAPKIHIPSWSRMACIAVGIFYPALILTAIIATANHFILDAVAGSMVCATAWWGNGVLLNLLVLEDWFLWVVRIHKPESVVVGLEEEDERASAKGLLRRWY